MDLVQKFIDIQEKHPVAIFLLNGVKLQGVIVNHDNDAIYLKRDNVTQLVMVKAICTILPIDKIEETLIKNPMKKFTYEQL